MNCTVWSARTWRYTLLERRLKALHILECRHAAVQIIERRLDAYELHILDCRLKALHTSERTHVALHIIERRLGPMHC